MQKKQGKTASAQSMYPCDVKRIYFPLPGMTEGPAEDPDFYWAAPKAKNSGGKGLDAQCLIEDWEDVEDFFATFPDPESPALIPGKVEKDERYLLFCEFFKPYYQKLIDTYRRPEGRLMLTMGNGSTEDWKRENMVMVYEESLRKGVREQA